LASPTCRSAHGGGAALVHGLIGGRAALLPLCAGAGTVRRSGGAAARRIPLGGLLFQIPFSHLSDRYGRRTMMAMSALATAALSLVYLLPTLPGFGWIMLLTTLWGGAPAALYLLAVAHANDIATDAQRIGWSSTLLLLWGIGAAVGPLAASLLMERFGYDMLFVSAAGLSCGLALFLGLRKLIRKRGDRREPAGNIIGPAPGASGS
jgi:MFS family permease